MRLACRLASAVVGAAMAVLVSSAAASVAQANSQPALGALRPAQSPTDTFKRLYDFGLGKRASYVAEYKRLPMYNFGIGKRAGLGSAPTMGAAPMGAATMGAAPQGMYAFGIGKRADDDPESDDDFDLSQNDVEDASSYDLNKRGKMYNFGLGKRGRLQYAFGIGKRTPLETDSRLEDFLLGPEGSQLLEAEDLLDANSGPQNRQVWSKRRAQQYSFGLGKRRGRYEFGLGKRTTSTGAD